MTQQIFAYIIQKGGKIDDTALELVSAAKKINSASSVTALVAGAGETLAAACSQAAASYETVWKIENEALAHVNAEVLRGMLVRILPKESIVLIPHEHFGMDLAPGLAVKLDAAYLPDAVGFEEITEGKLKAVREEYSGQVSTHLSCDLSGGAVITIRPGSFAGDESKALSGQVVNKSADAAAEGIPGKSRRFIEVVAAEVGDVDITKSEVLVSVGRGIEDQENLEMVNELAAVMGADVACSRPIVDAKWLEKSRQVGTSGQTVKPKVYLALGISGSFQHMGGIKGVPYIVAVNKNPKAPIFQVADVGVVENILEFIPALTQKVKEVKG
ncbi:MAG: electron transfer flavoprotein subunit alpha/FixB family protein [Desulfobacterales bacterium]|nr:electron transfer flavoprotein subunit alpha/FixB family protein [Desulfobacterales bacterium]